MFVLALLGELASTDEREGRGYVVEGVAPGDDVPEPGCFTLHPVMVSTALGQRFMTMTRAVAIS